MADSETKYAAFLSYSRAASGQLAIDLQHALERFAKPWNQLRAMRVFRDDSSMSANSGLWSAIQAGLRNAEWLVLLASPEAANSEYVAYEIRWWLEHRDVDRLLLVRAAGDIIWDRELRDFDRTASTAVPKSLQGAFAEEPRWVDFSWFDEPGSLGKSDPRFVEGVADLSAAIQQVDRDDLYGHSIREFAKSRRIARLVAVAVGVLAIALGAAGFQVIRSSDQVRSQLSINQSEQVVDKAREMSSIDMRKSLLLAVYGYKLRPSGDSRQTLYDVVDGAIGTKSGGPALVGFLDAGSEVTSLAGSTDGRFLVAGTADGRVLRWSLPSSSHEEIGVLGAQVTFVWVSDDGESVVASVRPTDDGPAASLIWSNGQHEIQDFEAVGVSPSGRTIVSIEAEDYGEIGTILIGIRQDLQAPRLVDTQTQSRGSVVLPDDNTVVVANYQGQVAEISVGSGAVNRYGIPVGGQRTYGVALSADGKHVTGASGLPYVEVWPLDEPTKVTTTPTGSLALDPVAWARPLTSTPSAIALDSSAQIVATARPGTIGLSKVSDALEGVEPALEIAGTGEINFETMSFLGSEYLLAASGARVGLWSTGPAGQLKETVTAEVPSSFPTPALGPQTVLVNPSGSRAVLVKNDGGTAILVDFESVSSTTVEGISPDFGASLSIQGGVWLDDDRFFALTSEAAYILSGPGLATVLDLWPMEASLGNSGEGHRLATVEGSVLVPSGNSLVRLDLKERTIEETGCALLRYPSFVTRPSDGKPLVASFDPDSKEGNTRVRVCNPESEGLVLDLNVDGWVTEVAPTKSDSDIALWAYPFDSLNHAPIGQVGESKLLSLSLEDGELRELGESARPGGSVSSGPSLLASAYESGWGPDEVLVIDASDGSPLTIAEVELATRQWTAVGVSGDGTVLVYANEPSGYVTAVRISPEDWIANACQLAGPDLTADEFAELVGFGVDQRPTCRG